MSFLFPLEKINANVKEYIKDTFVISERTNAFNVVAKVHNCFVISPCKKFITLPLGKWYDFTLDFPNNTKPVVEFTSSIVPYTVETDPKGYRDQDVVIDFCMSSLLEHHVVFLSLPTGFGKTSVATYLSSKLRRKTVILCHIAVVLDNQWVPTYAKFTNAKIQRVDTENTLDPNADVYIIGVMKVANINASEFVNVGTVIVDEAHLTTVSTFTNALMKIHPEYLIGLSATPDRKDGMHVLFDIFFNNRTIIRRETKKFVVYKCKSSFRPELTFVDVRGKRTLNWSHAINSIEYNPDRQRAIAMLTQRDEFKALNTMVLCNRVENSQGVYNVLKEIGESVDILAGTKKKWNDDARILVAGQKKAGVGFDNPKLRCLINASDTTDVRQYEGRVRHSDAVIIDIVDDFVTFEKHWAIREMWYIERGAEIRHIKL